MRNRTRFWTGAAMGLIEVAGIGIYGLTKVNYSWITPQLVITALVVSGIVMYNLLAGILMWNGSGQNQDSFSKKSERRKK